MPERCCCDFCNALIADDAPLFELGGEVWCGCQSEIFDPEGAPDGEAIH